MPDADHIPSYADINATTLGYVHRSYLPPKQKSVSVPEPEVCIGYVEGWRWFDIGCEDEGLQPVSVNQPYVWKWGENVAMNALWTELVRPSLMNSFGFYAYKSDWIAAHKAATFGRVALYGDVVEHKFGYRAEKARILDLWCSEHDWPALSAQPQVKGVYRLTPARLLNADGVLGGYQCLTLENRRELRGTSLSNGPTVTMLVDRSRPSDPSAKDWSNLSVNLPMPAYDEDGAFLYTDGLCSPIDMRGYLCPRIERLQPLCPVCNGHIQKSHVVAVQWDISAFLGNPAAVRKGTALKRKIAHLHCLKDQWPWWLMEGETAVTWVGVDEAAKFSPPPTLPHWVWEIMQYCSVAADLVSGTCLTPLNRSPFAVGDPNDDESIARCLSAASQLYGIS